VAYLKVLSWHSSRSTKKSYENLCHVGKTGTALVSDMFFPHFKLLIDGTGKHLVMISPKVL
jgi:hypothetical protein